MTNTYTSKNILDLAKEKKFKKITELCFYNWFCKDSSLLSKTKSLTAKFQEISNSSKFKLEETYIILNNNRSINGYVYEYDDFRICDVTTRDVIYTIIPSSEGQSEIWGKENNFEKPLLEGNWNDVLNFFNKN